MKVELRREESGVYVTPDGRYEVSRSWAEGWCDDPHPVQIPKATRLDLRERIRNGEAKPADVDQEVWQAVLDGKKGYHCEGGMEHAYISWGVWNRQREDYVTNPSGQDGNDFRTKKEAVAFLADHLERTS
jgi:hypothetical protein